MKVRPCNALILVEIEPDEKTLPSGITIGHGMIERPEVITGIIRAVGPGKRISKGPRSGHRVALPVHPGDRVWLRRSAAWLELPGPGELVLVDWYDQIYCAEALSSSGESEAL